MSRTRGWSLPNCCLFFLSSYYESPYPFFSLEVTFSFMILVVVFLLKPNRGVMSRPSSSRFLDAFSDLARILAIWAARSSPSYFSFYILFDLRASFLSFLNLFRSASLSSSGVGFCMSPPSLSSPESIAASKFLSFRASSSSLSSSRFSRFYYLLYSAFFALSSFLAAFFSRRLGGTAFFIRSSRPRNLEPFFESIATLIIYLVANWTYAIPFPIKVFGSLITLTFKIPSPVTVTFSSFTASLAHPEKCLLRSSSFVMKGRLPIKMVVSKSFDSS